MLSKHPGFAMALAFGAGIAAGSCISGALAAVAGVAGGLILVGRTAWSSLSSRRHRSLLTGPPRWLRPSILFLLGVWRGAGTGAVPVGPPIHEGPVILEGIVTDPPVEVVEDRKGLRSLWTLFTVWVPDGPGSVQVRMEGSLEHVRGGDRVRIRGTLLPPARASNPGDLEGRRSLLIVEHPRNVDVLAAPDGPSGTRLLGRARGLFIETFARLYPDHTRGFVVAMILGDRRTLAADIRDGLLFTGTYHLLAISGLHVVLIMFIVVRIPLPRRAACPSRLLFLVAFTLLTGASPPVARAALMFALQVAAERSGRRTLPLNLLGWTALILLAMEPLDLRDVGFQLSFVAVFSILTWGARLMPAATLPAPWKSLLSSLGISLATSVGTAPLIAFYFQRVHLLGPFWNLLAYPLTLVALLGGLSSLALGLIHPVAGAPVAWVVDAACEALLAPLIHGARFPGSSLSLPAPSAALVALSYGIYLAGLAATRRRVLLAASLAAVIAACTSSALRPRDVEFWQLDVGEGSAGLLSLPGAGAFLVDAGSRGLDSQAGARLARAILATGNRSLHGVFLTHFHGDHTKALPGLALLLPVGEIWVPLDATGSQEGRRLLRELRRMGLGVREVRCGTRLSFPGAPGFSIEVLHPGPEDSHLSGREENDHSLALRLQGGNSRLLILGDLKEKGIARLFQRGDDLRGDVLVAPHHGRPNLLWPETIEAVRPAALVITGGGAQSSRRVAASVEAKGIPVFATWRRGAVRMLWSASRGWEASYWRDG